jgi:uncharacterized paraquat-inducible protein A
VEGKDWYGDTLGTGGAGSKSAWIRCKAGVRTERKAMCGVEFALVCLILILIVLRAFLRIALLGVVLVLSVMKAMLLGGDRN